MGGSPAPAAKRLNSTRLLLTDREINFAYDFVEQIPVQKPVIVIIGAGAGVLSSAILETGRSLELVSIDHASEAWLEGFVNGMKIGLDIERTHLQENGLLEGAAFRQILGDSAESAKIFEDRSVDVVFVDGDHSEEGCARDVLAWMPKVKIGGFMAIHDYHTKEAGRHPFPGVDIAVDRTISGVWEKVALVDTLVVFRKPDYEGLFRA